MTLLFTLVVVLTAGLFMTRLARPLQFPDVTGYLIAGILIGPFCLGALGIPGLGLNSLKEVQDLSLFSEISLGFIAFAIGNEFRLSQLKKNGKQATVIGIVQSVLTSVVVDLVLLIFHFIFPEVLTIPVVLCLGAIAAATAPAATLMVVRQYKAKGPVTDLLLPIVALDDAVGLVIFAVSFGVSKAMIEGGVDAFSIIVNPLIEILISLLMGAAMGCILTFFERFFHSRSKRLTLAVLTVLMTVAISMISFEIGPIRIGFSSLLACMMLGTMFCNLCDFSAELMDRCDRWTAPLYIIFFVLSGAELDFTVFSSLVIVGIGLVFIASRAVGKYSGALIGTVTTHCDTNTIKYLGITLMPQAGVELGMSLQAEQMLGAEGRIIRNIVLFSVMIYMLIAPTLTKIALQKAGEIKPEERKSARVKLDKIQKTS